MDMQDTLFPENMVRGDEEDDSEDLMFKLQTLFPRMSKSHKKISTYILENTDKFLNCSISQLAQKIGTHPSTITRYCQSLGFAGFSEFKYRITQAHYTPQDYRQGIRTGDSIASIKHKMRGAYVRMMDNTIMNLDEHMLKYAADLILNSNKIFLFGHGGSSYISQFAQMLFIQIGITCQSFTNPPLAATASTLLGKGDLAIAFSSSGNSIITVDALRSAKEREASTIGITASATHAFAGYADVLLSYASVPKDDMRYFHLLKTAEMAVVGVLQLCVLMKNCDQLTSQLEVYKNAFFGKDYVY